MQIEFKDIKREDLVSIKEATVLVGVSRRTIYNWMVAGLIDWVELAKGTRRIMRTSLFRDAGTKAMMKATNAVESNPS